LLTQLEVLVGEQFQLSAKLRLFRLLRRSHASSQLLGFAIHRGVLVVAHRLRGELNGRLPFDSTNKGTDFFSERYRARYDHNAVVVTEYPRLHRNFLTKLSFDEPYDICETPDGYHNL